MAKFVVPSRKDVIVRCWKCKTLYVPEKMQYQGSSFFEDCPLCHSSGNDWSNTIPLWKYNLIKLFRVKIKGKFYDY